MNLVFTGVSLLVIATVSRAPHPESETAQVTDPCKVLCSLLLSDRECDRVHEHQGICQYLYKDGAGRFLVSHAPPREARLVSTVEAISMVVQPEECSKICDTTPQCLESYCKTNNHCQGLFWEDIENRISCYHSDAKPCKLDTPILCSHSAHHIVAALSRSDVHLPTPTIFVSLRNILKPEVRPVTNVHPASRRVEQETTIPPRSRVAEAAVHTVVNSEDDRPRPETVHNAPSPSPETIQNPIVEKVVHVTRDIVPQYETTGKPSETPHIVVVTGQDVDDVHEEDNDEGDEEPVGEDVAAATDDNTQIPNSQEIGIESEPIESNEDPEKQDNDEEDLGDHDEEGATAKSSTTITTRSPASGNIHVTRLAEHTMQLNAANATTKSAFHCSALIINSIFIGGAML